MDNILNQKVLSIDSLTQKIESFKLEGKTIVQSHGVFDIIYPETINHLNQARSQGDVLIVSVIQDRDVKREPGRPIFSQEMRAECVASLTQVDFVVIVSDSIPFESLKIVKPHILAKIKPTKENSNCIDQKNITKIKSLFLDHLKIYETDAFHSSAVDFFNNKFFDNYPENTREFLRKFVNKYSYSKIEEKLDYLQSLKVLVIGDGIIDEYHYCDTLGKAAKSNLVVNKFLDHEVFAGGTFGVANHLASICENVHLVSLLGSTNSQEEFILNNLKSNISVNFFSRPDSPSTIKKRYIHQYTNQKLFEVNFLNDKVIETEIENKVVDYLENIIAKYDLVLLSDFGHGFISEKIYSVIEKKSKILAVNAQTNAANAGYNLITKYHNPNFVCLDEPEIRLAAQSKYGCIDDIALEMRKRNNADFLIVTLGKHGSIGVDRNGNVNRTPIFSNKVIDTIGAGDAFFSFCAPCFSIGMELDLVSFIGNAVGALAVQIMGNKRSVEKQELLNFIKFLLNKP